jgi:MFS family permease
MTDNTQSASILGKFLVLKGAARELWITFALKFLGVTAYKLMNVTLVLWLSSDFGMSDRMALRMVLAWSLTMTVVTLLVGSLTDAIGLRKTFFLGVWICVIARAVMAFTTVKWLALACGLFPLAVGEALCTPVLVAAIRKDKPFRLEKDATGVGSEIKGKAKKTGSGKLLPGIKGQSAGQNTCSVSYAF